MNSNDQINHWKDSDHGRRKEDAGFFDEVFEDQAD